MKSEYDMNSTKGSHVREGDKSLFLLPVEVQIKCHNFYQKRQSVESVDWYPTKVAGNNDEARLRLAPLWTKHEGRRQRVSNKPT
mgnify:CR=1 FL=1